MKRTLTTLIVMVATISSIMIMAATTTTVLAQTADRTFESEEDGFRLEIPAGWVIEDHDNLTYEGYSDEDIAILCPANEALPAIGGEYNCLAANLTDSINITRYPNLQSMPEFADLETPITTNDLLALSIQNQQKTNQTSDVQIQNNTDLDEFRKIVNLTMTQYDDAGTPYIPWDDFSYNVKTLIMFALSPDRNTGYEIFNGMATPNAMNRTEHSPAVHEVFNSFQIVESGGEEGGE
jgi:hypothetical protein